MSKRVLYIVVWCILCAAFSSVSAQGLPLPAESIELSLSSVNPTPGQTITITARSYLQDLGSSIVVWLVDGKEVKRGTGLTTLTLTAPTLGKKNTVNVSATDTEGARVFGSVSIGSGSMDLIVESNGYTHPLFLGKISPAFQNSVKIVAIPHLAGTNGVELDPKTLVYQWKKDDRVIEDQSGYGKQSVTIEGSLVPRSFLVNVTVRSRDGNAIAEGAISISPTVPSINFYIDDPLYGLLLNRAVTDRVYLGAEREATIMAVPFGFTKPDDTQGNLEYSWTINGTPRSDLASSQSIILRAPSNTAGTSDITLEIKNLKEILQGALNGFSVSFAATPTEEEAPVNSATF